MDAFIQSSPTGVASEQVVQSRMSVVSNLSLRMSGEAGPASEEASQRLWKSRTLSGDQDRPKTEVVGDREGAITHLHSQQTWVQVDRKSGIPEKFSAPLSSSCSNVRAGLAPEGNTKESSERQEGIVTAKEGASSEEDTRRIDFHCSSLGTEISRGTSPFNCLRRLQPSTSWNDNALLSLLKLEAEAEEHREPCDIRSARHHEHVNLLGLIPREREMDNSCTQVATHHGVDDSSLSVQCPVPGDQKKKFRIDDRPGKGSTAATRPLLRFEVAVVLTVLVAAIVPGTVKGVFAGTVSAPSSIPGCSCEDVFAPSNESMNRCQLASDFFIALAYFSIPLELLYFVTCSHMFPFRWIIIQFGAFIVLCGLTHFVAIWTSVPHSYSLVVTQTLLKALTAIVSCATAITLVQVIPELLHVKVREHFLKHKAAELDREMDVIKTQEEVGRHVRMLTHVIRSTLDRHKILNTTLVELSKTLSLENCTVWMPNSEGDVLELTHELESRLVQVPVIISAGDPSVQSIFQKRTPVIIPSTCALGRASNHDQSAGAMAAVRLPLLHVSNFKGGTPEVVNSKYAILVLVLPNGNGRQWREHELQMIEVVADQVAVALSHAAVFEDSQRTREKLVEQNKALQQARKDAETAIQARNDFFAVMNHEMRTPMHAIIALSSLLQEGTLTMTQRAMVDTVVKSSSLLSTLINDVLDFSRLEDGSLILELSPFDLSTVLREVGNLAKPMARGKGLDFFFEIADDVPTHVIGDEKRLLQTSLNVVGNAVKFTKSGFVSVAITVEKGDGRWDPLYPSWRPAICDGYGYIRFEVQDSGLGLRNSDIPRLFHKFVQADSSNTRNYGGTGLGLAICKKFVQLMHGHIWIESDGLGKGCIVTFVVRLQLMAAPTPAIREQVSRDEKAATTDLRGLKVLVTDDNSVNRIVTRRLLDRLGCTTTVVESGHQCLAALAQPGSSFEVLLLDLCMPEMDGYEVAKRIREGFRPEDRPLVVALTANTDKETRERCLQIGMDGIVLKPISLVDMSAQLLKLVRRPNAGSSS